MEKVIASRMFTKLINVRAEFADAGKCWALTSNNLPGLLLAGGDLAALLADLPNAIKLLFRLNYQMDVDVAEVDEDGSEMGRARDSETVSPLRSFPRAFAAVGSLAA